jgi:hypothetical protein
MTSSGYWPWHVEVAKHKVIVLDANRDFYSTSPKSPTCYMKKFMPSGALVPVARLLIASVTMTPPTNLILNVE